MKGAGWSDHVSISSCQGEMEMLITLFAELGIFLFSVALNEIKTF